jgi:probable phosphoglycerate mutase
VSSKTTLFIVRHGLTEWNVQHRLQGHKNSPLTSTGRCQALEVKQRLADLEIHKVYVSPLERALETMQLIIADRDVEIVKMTGLKEISLGPWEGKTKKETQQSHPLEYGQFWKKQNDFYLQGAETYQQLQERVVKTIQYIFSMEKNSNVLVVSHWIAIKVAIAYFTSTPLAQLSDIIDPGNGEVLTLNKEGNRVYVTGQRYKIR